MFRALNYLESKRPSFDFASHWRSYQSFSYYCDMADWLAIVQAIALEISQNVSHPEQQAVRVLDIGAGPCVTANLVSKLAWTHFNQETLWNVVEPNASLREAAKLVMQGDNTNSGLRRRHPSLSELIKDPGRECFDRILFMHSSYYIEEFFSILPQLEQELLIRGGKIIVLGLPSNSPFYLNTPGLVQKNNATQLEEFLASRRIKYSSQLFRSRVILPKAVLQSDQKLLTMYDFVSRHIVDKAEFLRLVRTCWGHDIDFEDRLIIWSNV